MRAENYVDEYLKGYRGCRDGFTAEDSLVLLGAEQMYRAGRDERYLAFLENCLRECVGEEGSCRINGGKEPDIESMSLGRILFFMLDETGEEKYRRAIENLMGSLGKEQRCDCGSFAYVRDGGEQIRLRDLFAVQPFYMEYETRFNRKERYGDIISQFDNVQKLLYNRERGLCYGAYDMTRKQPCADGAAPADFLLEDMGLYLAALADTMDGMSVQIFEQYKRLEKIFKQVLGGMLKYRDKESGLFYRMIDRGDVSGNAPDVSGNLLTAYSILKACQMGVLIREKYVHTGTEILESLIEGRFSPGEKGTVPSPKEAGAFMMAYGQYLLMKKEME